MGRTVWRDPLVAHEDFLGQLHADNKLPLRMELHEETNNNFLHYK